MADGNTGATQLAELLTRARASQMRNIPSEPQRRGDLRRLRRAVVNRTEALVAAVSADFSGRSRHETLFAEISMVLHDIDILLGELRSWVRPRRVAVDWKFLPARAEIWQQPLGVIGILSPWNYPLSLALMPLAAAIAAGNHVLLKPSEHTPQTSKALAELLADVFPSERVSVVLGGPEVAQAFSALAFDHLFFTGSTQVGRQVMRAAAEHLTPVTLELGGKSPAVIAPEVNLARAVERIAAMKFINAGQTCIAPDYVLTPVGTENRVAEALMAEIRKAFPDPNTSADYTSIINEQQFDRLERWLTDAESRGAIVHRHGTNDRARRRFAPTVVLQTPDHSELLHEEIFGPILPIVSYNQFDDALQYVRSRPRPLAYYQFDLDRKRIDYALTRIVAGGVCINDIALHFAQPELPFGGVGPSGMGHYHGKHGLQTFSKAMPVFRQAAVSSYWWIKAPYGKLADWLARWLTR